AEDAIEIANSVIFDMMDGAKPKMRFKNLPKNTKKSISNLRQSDKNKLLKIPGIIRNVGEKEAKLKKAVYTCKRCNHGFKEVENPENPNKCPSCGKNSNKTTFILDENRSEYEDIQKIKVQEPTEKLEGGRQPDSIVAVLKNDLVGELTGGERVDLNSILKLKKKNKNSDTYKKYLKVNNIEIKERTFSAIELSEKDIQKIEKMKEEEDVFEKIYRSIAPDIYGMEEVKQAITLQLFGGVRKMVKRSPKRGDIHILLVGDPGTAKSQLLHSLAALAPKSMYESGKGSSGVGLTASVVKDEDIGGWTVEAGVLPLCDGGIACIDELDKMSEDDREHMNDAMGTAQSIPIAKAGKTMTLRSRTAVLAAGNPKYGRFDIHDEISNQIDIHPSLVDRFDLIFPILDQPNNDVEHDRKKTEHIAAMHRREGKGSDTMGELDDELIRKYVAYARRIRPDHSKKSQEEIIEFYNELRRESDDSVKITPRQLDTLHRMAEASARSRLSEEVEHEDAKRAIEVFGYFLKEVSTDSEGKIDIDSVMTGYTSRDRTLIKEVREAIKAYKTGSDGVKQQKIIENVDAPDEEVEKELERMKNNGQIYETEKGVYELA
ncbi:MAG: minichromosome maintenance protein MCM, partial [Candidatus Thermoplasmatota archaeon]